MKDINNTIGLMDPIDIYVFIYLFIYLFTKNERYK